MKKEIHQSKIWLTMQRYSGIDDDHKQIYAVLRVYNISYDTMEYDTKERVLIVYKHSSSWVRRSSSFQ